MVTWHVLDAGSVWIKEFSSALDSFVPSIGWSPVMSWTGLFEHSVRLEELADPPLRMHHFPLQRAYHRFPLAPVVRLGATQTRRMRSAPGTSEASPLICTTPYYAPVAERWNGPVVYYQTDLTYGYAKVDPAAVLSLDQRMCRAATAVCPNSRRIAEYMTQMAGCDPAKITIIPNATRQSNILPEPPHGRGPVPADLAGLRRPVLGVIGNLAGNLNWSLLREAIDRTPQFSWAFVGPTSMPIEDASEHSSRAELLRRGGRVRFVGAKPYKALQEYARCFDAAVLPYQRKEPTFSGSSTRYYEHLAACRPMIATRGFEELLRKQPLLTLIDTSDDLLRELQILATVGFEDGLEDARWSASQQGTWHNRALGVVEALSERWPGELGVQDLPDAWHQPEDSFEISPKGRFAMVNTDVAPFTGLRRREI